MTKMSREKKEETKEHDGSHTKGIQQTKRGE